ncbi:MAG: hypothetical protein H3C34_09955 [Caldilineaceae bacterium]|nr:hypothetical protein [Caldilineaceae bacterium]
MHAHDRARALAAALWLFLLLVLVYLLGYSGVVHAVDEISALSVTETMLLGQGFHVNQMEWDQARTPPQNSAGVDGNLYSKKGIGPSLLALPFFWLGKQSAGAGAVQLTLLAGALVTALAAVAMFYLGLALGYTLPVALAGGLALGLATPLWPYARTLFSESLAALGLAVALWGAAAFRHNFLPGTRSLLLASAGLAVMVLAKSSNGVVLPLFGLYMLYVWLAERRTGLTAATVARESVAFGVPVGLAVAITLGYNYVRFRTLFGFPLEPYELFNTPPLTGLAGLLLSPGKGILWYMPLAWLTPFFVRSWRAGRRMPDFALALAAVAALVALYALWYDWPGGRSWGPRMIVPAVPVVAMLAYPALEWLLAPRRWRAARIAAAAVLVLSVVVQLPGVLVNFERQEGLDMQAGASFSQLLWDVTWSPLVTYWRHIRTASMDPLWAQPYLAEQPAMEAGLLLAAGAGAVTLVFALRRWRKGRQPWSWLGISATATVMLAAGLVLAAGPDPRWDEHSAVREDNAALLELVESQARAGDLVLLDLVDGSDAPRRTGLWLNQAPLQPYLGWRRKAEMDGAAGERLQLWLAPYRRVWLALQATDEGDPASTTERWLNRHAYAGRRGWIGSQRYVEYLLPAAQSAAYAQEGPFTFGDAAQLARYAVTADAAGFRIDLEWNAVLPSARFSVQALDAAGTLVAQVDGVPGSTPGGLSDRIGLAATSGVGAVILKVYLAADGTVAPVVGPGGGAAVEYLSLAVAGAK